MKKQKSLASVSSLTNKPTINNIPRDKFNGKSPYEKTKEKYPLLLEKLNYKYINPDDVTLTKESILGDE